MKAGDKKIVRYQITQVLIAMRGFVSRHSMIFRGSGFALIFGSFQLWWEAMRGSTLEYVTIHDGTVQPAARLANWITPQIHAIAVKFSLQAPGGGLNILNGCEGLEALFLLLAAFAVAPFTWRSRLAGVLLGIAVVFTVNQARILLLFYAYRANHAWFDPLHATIAPIAVILAVSVYFYAWLFLAQRHAKPA